MFGLGIQEVLLLGMLAVVPVTIAIVVLLITKRNAKDGKAYRDLEEENRRLRDELRESRKNQT